jgi:hypothetical protein
MKKRRHHFVWQYYLKPWTVNGRIACWRKGQVFWTDPVNVAVEKDFYRLRDISRRDIATIRQMIQLFPSQLRNVHNAWLEMFTLPFELERISKATGQSDRAFDEALDMVLSNTEEEIHALIEADAQSLLQSLRNGDVGFFGTEDGFSRFMHFLSLQYLRTKNISTKTAAGLDPRFLDADSTAGVLRHILAGNMTSYFLPRRSEYALTLLHAGIGTQFVTSDQPVLNTFGSKVPEGVEPEDLEFYYPITPACAVIVGRRGTAGRSFEWQLEANELDEYNRLMSLASSEQLFAASEELLWQVASRRTG